MMKSKQFASPLRVTALAAALAVAFLAYDLDGVLAEGAPQMEPLVYSGVLVESGVEVTGDRQIAIRLSDADGLTVCTTAETTVHVESGNFRLPLSVNCVGAVASTPDVWVEVEVDGVVLPRTHISAVPYAVTASYAARATVSEVSDLGGFIVRSGTTGWSLQAVTTLTAQSCDSLCEGQCIAAASSTDVPIACSDSQASARCLCASSFVPSAD